MLVVGTHLHAIHPILQNAPGPAIFVPFVLRRLVQRTSDRQGDRTHSDDGHRETAGSVLVSAASPEDPETDAGSNDVDLPLPHV